ncbi:AN1-type zinc finger protein 5-like [Grus japonensis]|uniref:AN1-type zinc finger protein 5-like n=1 Tax=Grus japonensis TaxID=30415 RepID=A0ABC9W0M5_GRUJA
MEKTTVRQAVPLQPLEVCSGADIYLQPMEDPTLEEVDASKGDYDPMASLCWSRLLAGPVALWREEPMPGQLMSDKNVDHKVKTCELLDVYYKGTSHFNYIITTCLEENYFLSDGYP